MPIYTYKYVFVYITTSFSIYFHIFIDHMNKRNVIPSILEYINFLIIEQ